MTAEEVGLTKLFVVVGASNDFFRQAEAQNIYIYIFFLNDPR